MTVYFRNIPLFTYLELSSCYQSTDIRSRLNARRKHTGKHYSSVWIVWLITSVSYHWLPLVTSLRSNFHRIIAIGREENDDSLEASCGWLAVVSTISFIAHDVFNPNRRLKNIGILFDASGLHCNTLYLKHCWGQSILPFLKISRWEFHNIYLVSKGLEKN